MNRCIALMTVLAVVLGAGGATQADENDVVLYTNDFGTQEQFDGVSWQTLAGGPSLVLDSGNTYGGDMDGDGLFNSVRQDVGFGRSRGVIKLSAPIFKQMSNIRFTGAGWGTTSFNTGGGVELSYNNSEWQYSDLHSNAGSPNWRLCEVAPGVYDPNYNRVATTYLGAHVWSVSGTYSLGNSGRVGYLKVIADVNDPGPGDRIAVYANDFGTQAQEDQWYIAGHMTKVLGYDLDLDGVGYRFDETSPCTSILYTKITPPAGWAFKGPIATGWGSGASKTHGSHARYEFSRDGHNWDISSTWPHEDGVWGGYSITLDASSDPCYDQVEELWIRLYMYAWHGTHLPKVGPPTVTAELVAAPAHTCAGDGVYLAADLTGPEGVRDCYVNLLDVAFMSAQWLDCTDPTDAACSP